MAQDIQKRGESLFESFGKGTIAPFDWLRSEVDHLFDEITNHQQRRMFNWPSQAMMRAPSVDLEDRDKEFRLTAELPGFEIGDVELEMKDGSLHLVAKREEMKEERKDAMLLCERQAGRIERLIPLPQAVDIGRAHATLRQGVLTVTLPKKGKPESEVRKIAVQA